MLEESEKMCEFCCNFDKEHIGMDCTALCKLTMTLAYGEDYGGDCMFYNVPKEQIIVPPCKVGDTVYIIWSSGKHRKSVADFVVTRVLQIAPNIWIVRYLKPSKSLTRYPIEYQCNFEDFGKTIFLTREEAEKALNERKRK